MIKKVVLVLIFLFSIPIIALADYAIFKGLMVCKYCNKNNAEWYSWIPACTLEALFFLSGLLIGGLI